MRKLIKLLALSLSCVSCFLSADDVALPTLENPQKDCDIILAEDNLSNTNEDTHFVVIGIPFCERAMFLYGTKEDGEPDHKDLKWSERWDRLRPYLIISNRFEMVKLKVMPRKRDEISEQRVKRVDAFDFTGSMSENIGFYYTTNSVLFSEFDHKRIESAYIKKELMAVAGVGLSPHEYESLKRILASDDATFRFQKFEYIDKRHSLY